MDKQIVGEGLMPDGKGACGVFAPYKLAAHN